MFSQMDRECKQVFKYAAARGGGKGVYWHDSEHTAKDQRKEALVHDLSNGLKAVPASILVINYQQQYNNEKV